MRLSENKLSVNFDYQQKPVSKMGLQGCLLSKVMDTALTVGCFSILQNIPYNLSNENRYKFNVFGIVFHAVYQVRIYKRLLV